MQLSKSEIDKIVTAHGEGMRKALADADGQRSSNRFAIYPAGGRVPNAIGGAHPGSGE